MMRGKEESQILNSSADGWDIDQSDSKKQNPVVGGRLPSRGSSNGGLQIARVVAETKAPINSQGTYWVEKEDDMGQQQQVSGGFGDSQHVDEETLLRLQQQK